MGAAGEALAQHLRGDAAHLLSGLVHAGQVRADRQRHGRGVVAHHAELFGDGHLQVCGAVQHPDRGDVVRGEHRGGGVRVAAAQGAQQHVDALLGRRPVRADHLAASAEPQPVRLGEEPGAPQRRARTGRQRDVGQPAMPPLDQVAHRERGPGLVMVAHRVGALDRVLHPPDHHRRRPTCGLLEGVGGQPGRHGDDAVHVQLEQPLQLPFQMGAIAPTMRDHHPEAEALRLRLDARDDVRVIRVPEVRGQHAEQARAAGAAPIAEPPRGRVHPLPRHRRDAGTVVQRHRRGGGGDPRRAGHLRERDARTAGGPRCPHCFRSARSARSSCDSRSARGSCWSRAPGCAPARGGSHAPGLPQEIRPSPAVLKSFRSRDRSVPRGSPRVHESARASS